MFLCDMVFHDQCHLDNNDQHCKASFEDQLIHRHRSIHHGRNHLAHSILFRHNMILVEVSKIFNELIYFSQVE